jgi:hypothetical protein
MTSLQYRDEKGVNTHEIQSNISAPTRLRLVKRDDYVYLWLGGPVGDLKVSGASIRSPLQGTFYVGIGVCSHDKDVVEKAVFSKVELTTPPAATGELKLYSYGSHLLAEVKRKNSAAAIVPAQKGISITDFFNTHAC